MLRTIRFCSVLFVTAISVWAGQEIKAGPDETIVGDEIVVRLKPGASLTGVLQSLNVSAATVGSGVSLPVQVIRVPAALRQAVSTLLASRPEIEYVEPHRVRTAVDVTANDTSFAVQWWLTKLQAGSAWSLMPGRLAPPSPAANRVRIAVLDTGADCTHPDFRNSTGGSTDSGQGGQFAFALSQAIIPTTIANPACPWQDDHGHGTHVAGILAAGTNNSSGVASLGFPTELMIFKVLDKTGSGPDLGVANAITMAADAGARVISLSLGGPGYSQLLQDAVNYAWARNTLVVAAAGNNNNNSLFYPGGSNYALGVGATDSNDLRASFSNYGFGVDVMAPGVSILSTYPGNTYISMSGTSMAAPLVASVAGLIASSTTELASDALGQRIESSADSTFAGGGWDQYYGYGRVNAMKSLSGALRPASVGGVSGQVVDASGMPVTGAQVVLGGVVITTPSTGLFRFGNLTSGTATLTVNDRVNTPWVYNVVIPPGADSSLRVVVGVPTGAFTGSVTSNGAAIGGAVVQALKAGLVQSSAVTDSNGQFTLPVAAGTYDLRSTAIEHAAFTKNAMTVAAGGSTFVALPMLPLGTVRGRVVDQAQVPLAGVQVTVDNGVSSAGAVTNALGEYISLGVPSSTYTVSASLKGAGSQSVSGVGVVNGSSGVSNFQLQITGSLTSLTVAKTTVGGSSITTGTVTLSAPAGALGVTVMLSSSNPAAAQVPASVTIPAGSATSASFNITTGPVAAAAQAVITTSYSGVSKAVTLTVKPILLSAFSASTLSISGGKPLSATVTLDGPAPTAGAVVTFTSSNPAVVTPPASVSVAAGATASAAFTISTASVTAAASVVLTASYNGVSKTVTVSVKSAQIYALTASTTLIVAGKPVNGQVVLDGPAPNGGLVVTLSSDNPAAASVPATVTVAAGATTSANFTITTSPVGAATAVVITASSGGASKMVTVNVKPAALYSFSVSATPISGGKSLSGATVTLDGPAPAGGAVVTIVSANRAAVMPPTTVTVAAGATVSPAFTLTTGSVSVATPVELVAAYGGVTKSVTVNVKPTALYALSLSTAPISGGKSLGGGVVTIDGPAPSGGAVITLSSANPAVAAPPATVIVDAGATVSPAFIVSTGIVTAETPVVITASYGGISKSITINVKPAALYSFYLPTAPTSGGKPLSGTVTLDGPAPATGAVVTLVSGAPSVVAVPATVTVASGATVSPSVVVATGYVTVGTPVVITATYGGVSKPITVNVKPTSLSAFYLSTVPVSGGINVGGGSLYVDGPASPSGAVIELTSSNPSVVSTPATVTIPSGATSVALNSVTTHYVSAETSVVITASYGGVSKSITLTVKPTGISNLIVPAPPVIGGKSITAAYLTIDGPAPPEGAAVTLTSSNPAVAKPLTLVTVAAGKTSSASFTITTSAVAATSQVTITASYGGVSKSVVFTVNP